MWDFVGSEFSANPSHHLLLKTLLVSHCWLEGQSHLAQSVGSGLSCLFQLSWIPHCLSSSHRSCFQLSEPAPSSGGFLVLSACSPQLQPSLPQACLLEHSYQNTFLLYALKACASHSTHHSCRFTFMWLTVYEGLFPVCSLVSRSQALHVFLLTHHHSIPSFQQGT